MIIIGSSALAAYQINRLPPKDEDIWCNEEERSGLSGDIHVIPQHILDLFCNESCYATPDEVYTIKCSHLGWSNPMWNKHKLDLLWLKSKGCKLKEDLYKALVYFWKEELGDKSFLSLSKGKEDFFTDNVMYKYDHDYLHELVSYPDKPMYTKVLKDNEEVLVDKNKFDKLSFEDKVRMFREEITVIAFERWLVNPKGNINWVKAYQLSLEKTITTLTKGRATEFIVLNLQHFYRPDYSYFKHLIGTIPLNEV